MNKLQSNNSICDILYLNFTEQESFDPQIAHFNEYSLWLIIMLESLMICYLIYYIFHNGIYKMT